MPKLKIKAYSLQTYGSTQAKESFALKRIISGEAIYLYRKVKL